MKAFGTQINKLDAKIDSLRNGSLGLLLLAILELLARRRSENQR